MARWLLVTTCVMFTGTACLGQSTQEFPPPNEMATSQLARAARELLEYGKAAEAIPYLQESIVRFEDADAKGESEARPAAMYELGLCALEAEDYELAIETFRSFIQEYPIHEQAMLARVLSLETFARLDDAARMTAYVDGLVASGEFDQLVAALNDPANADLYRNALVALITAYAQAADVEHVAQFLAFCDADARSDMRLNQALLVGGDRAVELTHYLDAIQLYRWVQTGPELLEGFDRRLSALQIELEGKLPWVPLKERALQQAHRVEEQQRFEQMKLEREALTENSYDIDLILRMGQCYEAMERHEIAIAIFQFIYTEFPESHLVETCRYLAFSSLLGMRELERARIEGQAYVEQFTAGRFSDEVTLSLMHVELGLKQLDATLELGRSLCAQSPIHRYLDQINYLMGYVCFQQADYETARTYFHECATAWPTRLYAEESTYWDGMCTLFLGDFDGAIAQFSAYLNESTWSPKAFADAVTYQLGMAYYGKEDDAKAKPVFVGFLEKFPESDLYSEACSMLGDLVGGEGELELGLSYYAQARETALNSRQFDYPTFQAVKAHKLLSQQREIIALLETYLAPAEHASRFAEAGLHLSQAWRATGDVDRALDVSCDLLARFGSDPQADGVDGLVDEILLMVRDADLLARATQRLTPIREQACAVEPATTLGLYLSVLFAQCSEDPEIYNELLVSQAQMDAFAPLPLVQLARVAVDRNLPERVEQASSYFFENFPQSERALAMTNLQIESWLAAGEFEQARAMAQTALEEDTGDPAMALTQKMAGDSLRLLERHDEAIELYKGLLKVRAWRGPLSPEALYWIAQCKRQQGDHEQAFAYFQRVYVLYSQYTDWVAKSYAESVQCLRDLGRDEEIARTWVEMVGIPEIAATPEGRAAQAGLDALQGDAQ